MSTDFPGAFAQLREMLLRHAKGMLVQTPSPTRICVVTKAIGLNKKPVWFGYINTGKSGVSYHLVPLYFNPKLQAQVPKELLARKQGLTCFNFQRPDAALFAHLERLTAVAREHYERAGFLKEGTITPEQMEAVLVAAGEDPKKIARVRKAKAKAAAEKRARTIKKKAGTKKRAARPKSKA